jgi:hypothetical protein
MQRHAIVKDGVVVQATMIRDGDTETAAALGAIPCPDWVSAGDAYDGSIFTLSQSVEVPAEVTFRQGMAVLIKYGLDTQIDDLLNAQLAQAQASDDEQAILDAKLAINDWKRSTAFERDWPLIEKMRQLKGWTQDYVDNLFIEAKTL